MRLVIFRHGQAENHAASDTARNLTDKGRAQVRLMAEKLAKHVPTIDLLWTSPYTRAQQTREEALPFFDVLQDEVQEHIKPSGSPKDVLVEINRVLEAQPDIQTIMLISHQPLVGTLVNELCGQRNDYYCMGTASTALIELEVVANDLGTMIRFKDGF